MTDPRDLWAPYVPSAAVPWDLGRVVRLHRCAGFAATWGEIRRDLADGPEPSISRLLSGTSRACGVPEQFDKHAATVAVAAGDTGGLKAWWVYRMLFGPDPLGERLVLMWHNHFATSVEKVNELGWMRRQNQTFRRHARGCPVLASSFAPPLVNRRYSSGSTHRSTTRGDPTRTSLAS